MMRRCMKADSSLTPKCLFVAGNGDPAALSATLWIARENISNHLPHDDVLISKFHHLSYPFPLR